MSGHHAKGVDFELTTSNSVGEAGEKVPVILPGLEDRSPRDAPVHHVMPRAGLIGSAWMHHLVTSCMEEKSWADWAGLQGIVEELS